MSLQINPIDISQEEVNSYVDNFVNASETITTNLHQSSHEQPWPIYKYHFFEKKLSMPGELLLLARVFPSTLGMAPYFFFIKIRSWGIIFPGHPRHLCSNTFH